MRKIILYIAMSLDGYIAKKNDDLSFLSIVQQAGEDYGYSDFISGVDTVMVGRKTYDWVMNQVSEFSHKDKDTYVITRTPRPSMGNVKFYTGNLKELVLQLKSQQGKDIFIDGGAEVVHSLMQDHLIDEFIISIIPICVGEGIKLFKDGRPETKLKVINCRHFEKGLVQIHYKRVEQ